MSEHETKMITIVGVAFAIAGAIGLCALHWSAAEQARAAVEHGYSQRLEGDHVLWVKDGKKLDE